MRLLLFALTFCTTSAFSQSVEKTFDSKTYVIPDSIAIADGSKISKAEFLRRCEVAWDNSFGKMTPEDKKLVEGVKLEIVITKKDLVN